MAEAAYDYFNRTDLPALPVATQAECLRSWARVEAKRVAAEAGLVAAFWASGGAAADGQRTMAAWLRRFGRCTRPAARAMVAASLRIRGHRHVEGALAEGEISASYARWIGDAVGRFDVADRDAVEEILVGAAASGALEEDLEKVATAALRRLTPGGVERGEAAAHADRGLTLSKTIGGVGRLNGDLDAEATALTQTVIDALAVKAGPEDDRTARQRRHDALAEAMRRLLASDLLPERGGAKPHLKIDIDLAALRAQPGAKPAEDAWIARRAAELAARRVNGATTQDLLTTPTPASPAGPANPAGPVSPDGPGSGVGRNPDAQPDARPDARFDGPFDGWAEGGRGAGVAAQPQGDREPYVAGSTSTGPPHHGVDGARQPVLPGLEGGASLAGVGPISAALAAALGCDSVVSPTVVAGINRGALAQMTITWLRAHGLRSQIPPGHDHTDETGALTTGAGGLPGRAAPSDRAPGHDADACQIPARGDGGGYLDGDGDVDGGGAGSGYLDGGGDGRGYLDGDGGGDGPAAAHQAGTTAGFLRLQGTMLRWAIEVLSGPGGLASYLRTRVLDEPLNGPSIVLDVGTDGRTVPASLERVVRRRDGRCRFPGCDHTAELSQVHHIIPVSQGGPTELWNLVCLCSFHHLIAVHGWGWALRLNPDGTTTATGPDGRVLHESAPPGDPPLRAA
jgi:hypothetical protein